MLLSFWLSSTRASANARARRQTTANALGVAGCWAMSLAKTSLFPPRPSSRLLMYYLLSEVVRRASSPMPSFIIQSSWLVLLESVVG